MRRVLAAAALALCGSATAGHSATVSVELKGRSDAIGAATGLVVNPTTDSPDTGGAFLVLSPSPLDFGVIFFDTFSLRTLVIANTGPYAASIDGIDFVDGTVFGPNDVVPVSNPCAVGGTLAAGLTCEVGLKYSPTFFTPPNEVLVGVPGLNGFHSDFLVVTYSEVAPIPIPAALPMLLAGLSGLGLVARRRARSG